MNTSRGYLNPFTKIIKKTIVQRYYKKKSVFEQHHMNPFHIAPFGFKKRESKFDYHSQTLNWPPEMPPANPLNGKALIYQLEKEEKEKIALSLANKKKEIVRLGDKIELEYFVSLTNKKTNKYKGIVIGTRRANSLTHSFRFLFTLDGYGMSWDLLFHSPMIASIRVTDKSTIRSKKTKIYHFKHINNFGTKILEVLKGGKSMNMTKQAKRKSRALKLKIRSGVIEE